MGLHSRLGVGCAHSIMPPELIQHLLKYHMQFTPTPHKGLLALMGLYPRELQCVLKKSVQVGLSCVGCGTWHIVAGTPTTQYSRMRTLWRGWCCSTPQTLWCCFRRIPAQFATAYCVVYIYIYIYIYILYIHIYIYIYTCVFYLSPVRSLSLYQTNCHYPILINSLPLSFSPWLWLSVSLSWHVCLVLVTAEYQSFIAIAVNLSAIAWSCCPATVDVYCASKSI